MIKIGKNYNKETDEEMPKVGKMLGFELKVN